MKLSDQYEHDRQVWDACAKAYEAAIVMGHPDVTAFENFEEDFLDRLLLFLTRDVKENIHLYDVGCGSGRLHLRYGLSVLNPQFQRASTPLQNTDVLLPACKPDPALASGLKSVGGLDFSSEMLDIARQKIKNAGLSDLLDDKLSFEQGSAFDLQPFPSEPVPVLIALCNSIGVMQGPEGAQKLFQAMRRAVENTGGIAIISAYRRDAIPGFALGNYESTMDASGQPVWLTPDTYAAPAFKQIPQNYKQAYDSSDQILVDVYDADANLVKKDHLLRRDPEITAQTIQTGNIRTHHEYESHWYDTEQFRTWIDATWPIDKSWHIAGSKLDALRAAPVQLAVLDSGNHLKPFFNRMGLTRRLENF